MARDKLGAVAPQTRVGPVVVGGEALPQLFGGTAVTQTGALLAQASAATAYSKLSRWRSDSPSMATASWHGDAVTVRANARLPFGVASYRFDADGSPHRTCW